MRVVGRLLVVLLVLAVVPFRFVTNATAFSGSVLYSPNIGLNPNEDANYPRVIRLAHSGAAKGTLLATFSHSGDGTPAPSFPIAETIDFSSKFLRGWNPLRPDLSTYFERITT